MSDTAKNRCVPVEHFPGERVVIDGEIAGWVTEVSCLPGRILYQVAWMHNGDSRKDYFDFFRLTAVSK